METYTLIFIIIPASFLIPSLFLTFVVNFIYEREKKKYGDKITKEEVKEKYLHRVSYVGIYNMHDKVDRLEQELAELKNKLKYN
jgi:hypothetical protein